MSPGDALGLTYWLIHVVLSAGESVKFPPESWQQAHTPPAKLAAWQSLGSRQSSNQTHPMFTKCVIMSLCHTQKKTQHVLSAANMSELLWTVFIRRFYLTGQQEVGGGLRRGLQPSRDHYLQVRQTTMSIKMDSLRRVHSPQAHLFATWLPFQEGFYSCGFTFEIQTASNWKGFGNIKLFLNHSNDGISEWLVGRRLCP